MIQANSNIVISGFEPFTTIDFPGKIACVIFLQGCNFRCKFCSNPETFDVVKKEEYDFHFKKNWIAILEKIERRKDFLDAIVFCGGEALVQADEVAVAIEDLKAINPNFKIGLHTNGNLPEKLRKYIYKFDWVGMDIKAPRSKYDEISGSKNSWNNIMASLDIMNSAGIKYEVRTTCWPKMLYKADILEIAAVCAEKGVKHYAIQKYIPISDSENEPSEQEINKFFVDEEFLGQLREFGLEIIVRD